jgi:3'(2'), 5'-bisphosphate nucleotidase
MQIDNIDVSIDKIINIAIDAGSEVLRIYQQDSFDQQLKLDDSPLTEADIAAHNLITRQLKKITPNVPILSEESKKIPWSVRKLWGVYWLIDPLDGTKEFIKKNGEFTVNIALIHKNTPVIGIVHAPVLNETWVGEQGKPAIKISKEGTVTIKTRPYKKIDICKVAISRSHAGDSLNKFLQGGVDGCQLISMGSSIKLCLVAEGKVHVYPRLGLTSEWDTAAAHAVVNSAGGEVFEFKTKTPLKYNTKDSLLNSYFIAQDKSSTFL